MITLCSEKKLVDFLWFSLRISISSILIKTTTNLYATEMTYIQSQMNHIYKCPNKGYTS